MIFFKLLFFLIGLFGLSIIWLVIGFVITAVNQEQIEYSRFSILKKTVIMGPLYVLFCLYSFYLKRKKRSIKF